MSQPQAIGQQEGKHLSFKSFDEPVYTLVVGPELQKLNVPKYILKRIPYFDKPLTEGTIDPAVPFIIDDCKAQGIIDVLAFIRDSSLPLSSVETEAEDITRLVKTYIVAHKFGAEDVENAITDSICSFCSSQPTVDPATLVLLNKAHLGLSKLYELLIREMAHDIRLGKYRSDTSNLEDSPLLKTVMKLKILSKEDLLMLVFQLSMLSPSSIRSVDAFGKDPCRFHIHRVTPPCSMRRA